MNNKKINEETQEKIKGFAQGMVKFTRTPILKTPADYDLEYEELFFHAMDGITLEAWFIPAKNSNKLIICNHPGTMSRYGYPGHLEPWSSFNPIEVELIKIYKNLHDAGYNVLTYDMRNHGRSAAAHDGIGGYGLFEYRDVIGAMQYVQTNKKLKDMEVGLFNPCAGGNAAMIAISKHPEYFKNVKAFVCPQPTSGEYTLRTIAKLYGLGDYIEEIDFEMIKEGGFSSKDLTPHPHVQNVNIPTFIIQVKDDVWTVPDDVQNIFDAIPTKEKKLFWIEGTTQRFDGYNYFGKNPEQMIEWFDKYMK